MKRLTAGLAATLAIAAVMAVPAANADPGYRIEESFPLPTGYTPGTAKIENDDTTVMSIALPFTHRLYDVARTSLNTVSNQGYLAWGNSLGGGSDTCALPASGHPSAVLLPFWTGDTYSIEGPDYGIYTKTESTAPTRRFIIEWRQFLKSNTAVKRNFEVVLREDSPIITTMYVQLAGADASIGVQRGPSGPATVAPNCGSSSSSGRRLDFIPDPRMLAPPALARDGQPVTADDPPQVRAGDMLSVSVGTWDGTAPIGYQTQIRRCDSLDTANCTDVGGATDAQYVVSQADVNRRLRVRVTATTPGGSDTSQSLATAIVGAAPPGVTPPTGDPDGGGAGGGGGGAGGGAGGGGGAGAGGGAGDPSQVAVTLAKLRVKPSQFTPAGSGGPVQAAATVGTRVSYRLSEPATTTFRIERAAAGRRVKGKCARPTRGNRGAPRCTRWVRVKGSFRHAGGIGANALRFTGRLRGRALVPGSHRVVAVATDLGGQKSKPARARFTVKR